MAYSADAPRRIVIRANRETLALVGGACAVTFVLAYGLHGQPPQPRTVAAVAPQQDWTGHLAELPPAETPAVVAEPLSSESLTVPKAQLALPAMPSKAKVRPCDPAISTCAAKVTAPVPPAPPTAARRQLVSASPTALAHAEKDRGLMHTLNPLNHLPDMAMIKKPFAFAGDTVSGWIKRF